jgi:signal transduction histidine kinase
MKEYTSAVDYSREIVNSLERLSNHFKSAQIYSLQYEIRSKQQLYQFYKDEAEGISTEIERLQYLIKNNTEQERRVDTIAVWIDKHMDILLEKNIAEIVNEDASWRLHDILIIHQAIKEAIAHELNVLGGKEMYLKRSTKLTSALTIIFSIMASTLIAWAFVSNVFLVRKRKWLEGFLESVLNTTQNGIVTYTALREEGKIVDFEIEFANPALYKLLGLSQGQLIGKKLKSTSSFIQNPALLDAYINVVENRKVHEMELYYDHKNINRWFYVVLAKRGDGITATFHDISDLKRYEEELKSYIKQLEYSNKELEQYAYAASHDLQEPLRKIRTFGSFLEETQSAKLDEKGKDYLNKIIRSAERMSTLINDILTFSSLKNEAELVETDLNVIIKDVLQDLELLISQKGALVKVDQLPVIQAVPLHMNQLFYNLVNNALKFSHPEKKPEIHINSSMLTRDEVVEYKSLRPNMTYYKITCADNGLGFEPAMSEQIFGLFKRLGDRQTFPGSGIGLALCRKVVLNHHGVIYGDGEAGKGAAFHIVLPVIQPE